RHLLEVASAEKARALPIHYLAITLQTRRSRHVLGSHLGFSRAFLGLLRYDLESISTTSRGKIWAWLPRTLLVGQGTFSQRQRLYSEVDVGHSGGCWGRTEL